MERLINKFSGCFSATSYVYKLFLMVLLTSLSSYSQDPIETISLTKGKILHHADSLGEMLRDTVEMSNVRIVIDVPSNLTILSVNDEIPLAVLDESDGSCIIVNIPPNLWDLDCTDLTVTNRRVIKGIEYEVKGYKNDSITKKYYRMLRLPDTLVTMIYLNVDSQKVTIFDSIVENVEAVKLEYNKPPTIFEQIINNLANKKKEL